MSDSHILEVDHLKTHFYTMEGIAKAVDDVSFYADAGETLGIVGESGSGKSVTVLSVMGLIPSPPGRITGGQIRFHGQDLLTMTERERRKIRGNRISMIFQEPMTSLNPVYTVGHQIAEMFMIHQGLGKRESHDRAVDMLDRVRIPAPSKRAREFPHELSGGMRQRAMIAMALSCNPEILIADEPTTALDVTIQAQILDLMLELKEAFDTSVLMITHDLGVIAQIARRMVVMYAGRVVEEGLTRDLFDTPLHPYTRGLLNSVPRLGRRARYGRERLSEIPGMVPSLYDLPDGCCFAPRCPECMPRCREQMPELKAMDGPTDSPINGLKGGQMEYQRKIRCHLY